MIERIFIIFLVLSTVIILILSDFGNNSSKVYDCRLAEISPDYPLEVRELCRNIRAQEYKLENQKQKTDVYI